MTDDTFEGVNVISAPIITFNNAPYTVAEGGAVTITALIAPLGSTNTLVSTGWDLTGSGQFGDATGTYNAATGIETLTLTARQLLGLGIGNAGSYTVGLMATNADGLSSEKFTTLTILYTAPIIALTGASSTTVGTPYTINFSATSVVPDPITQWVVNWGDGTVQNPDLQTFGAGVSMATHTFTTPGTPDIQVFATDTESPTPVASPVLPVTVTVSQASVSAGGPYTIAEGGTLSLAATAPGNPTGFSWDINGNVGAASGQTATLTWAQLEGLCASGQRQRHLHHHGRRVYGATDVISAPVDSIVTNTAPTATLVNNGPVNEGSTTATVSFTNVFDPSFADTMAGFTYKYDFTNTGNSVTGTGPTATVPTADLLTPGDHVVNAEIIDKDGGTTTVSTTIQVNYVAPVLTLSGNPTSVEGATYQLTVSAAGSRHRADPALDRRLGRRVGAANLQRPDPIGRHPGHIQPCLLGRRPAENQCDGNRPAWIGECQQGRDGHPRRAADFRDFRRPRSTKTSSRSSPAPSSASDSQDTYTLKVDWGDGTNPTTLTCRRTRPASRWGTSISTIRRRARPTAPTRSTSR